MVSLSICFMMILLSAFTFLFYNLSQTFSFLKCFKSQLRPFIVYYNSVFCCVSVLQSFLISLIQLSLQASNLLTASISILSFFLSVSDSSKSFSYSICIIVFFSSRLSFNRLRLLMKLAASSLCVLVGAIGLTFDYDSGFDLGLFGRFGCEIFVINLPQDWLTLDLHCLMFYSTYFNLFLRSFILYFYYGIGNKQKQQSAYPIFYYFITSPPFAPTTLSHQTKKLLKANFLTSSLSFLSFPCFPISPHIYSSRCLCVCYF